jgi:hypothetical protein
MLVFLVLKAVVVGLPTREAVATLCRLVLMVAVRLVSGVVAILGRAGRSPSGGQARRSQAEHRFHVSGQQGRRNGPPVGADPVASIAVIALPAHGGDKQPVRASRHRLVLWARSLLRGDACAATPEGRSEQTQPEQ